MKIWQKIKYMQNNRKIKKCKVFGLTVYKRERSPGNTKWHILGIKISKSDVYNKIRRVIFPEDAKPEIFINDKVKNSIKRLAIFASFSAEGKIDASVVYYLKELNKVCDAIIFIADNPVIPSEIKKVKELVIYAKFEHHQEYDFGSYKRGFLYAQEIGILKDCNEIVFCNDSCYGPVFGFSNLFSKMKHRKCDFWGVSNQDISYHIQSYFIVIKSRVFNSAVFKEFLSSIRKQKKYWTIVLKYEIGLSKLLIENGYKASCCVPDKIKGLSEIQKRIKCYNKTVFPMYLMRQYKFPLIKKKIFTSKLDCTLQISTEEILAYLNKINLQIYEIIIKENDIRN